MAVNEAAFTLTGGLPTDGMFSGNGISGGMFDPAAAGEGTHTITYTYVDGNTCENSAQQSIIVEGPNGIDDMIDGIKFSIYPNPTNGKLFLELSSRDNQKLNVTIVNQIGVTVMNKAIYLDNLSKSEFDLTQLASGIYFLNIKGNNINLVRKVVVQK